MSNNKLQEPARLDITLVRRGLTETREKARQLIKSGNVQVNAHIAAKPSMKIHEKDSVLILEQLRYVGRGGLKLEAALKQFAINVNGLVALDVGASTGGFTDCLLQHGAEFVYAVDVGYNQLSPKLRAHPHVTLFEHTDIRKLESLPQLVDLVVIDVSFISLRRVLPEVNRFLKQRNNKIIALIKPQFEAGPHTVNKKGIIKNPVVREKTVQELLCWIQEHGWIINDFISSPILGGDGNTEYLIDMTYLK
ncbi:MAG: TlyA family RNA methyltransferase [Acidobacteria bacterium]|jgi:23S rRNA (cytidine1920-2'-O)/16S rRNA (cytidine1409-2'-O)-methyltransferase|nr:TlyA family RNA methyltransferase [Acidobacteriota bacterium]